MGATPSLHPTDQTLQAYGLGTLGEDASASVDSHLAECSACRQRAAEMSGDSFLGRLREAHGDAGTKGGSSSMAGAKRRASSSVSDDGPPRELVDHPDYEVVRELGRGGMGVVYLANNTLMGRMEVLKVVGSHLVKRQGVLDRFLREIRSAAKLHHPNIVGAYAAMRLGDCVVLAMEYVEGEDLAQLVKARGALPVTNACYFTYQAALGLQHAHERGMVHRDIKPANLILAREGKKAIVKVLDFGLAKATSEGQLDSGLTHEGQMLGTPDFIAPEQIVDAQRADIRADVYSLGCTLYYLLSGGAPFRATSLYELLQAHHSMDAPALNMVRPEVPSELAALVAKMMAKDPARRFQTPGEVSQALTKFFKPGAQPSSTSNAEVPRAVPPVPAPPPTIPATDLGAPALAPVSKKLPSKPGPEGVAWESLI
ncbi:MAG TPA: protein kinase, partial [Isosphaeraceae bacterium]